ncbi:fibronectin type III domain-containing protein [Actinoplanes sp. NBC_00393]|uniref:fibronectin type III domain-containing protein n=1 Tax=Actinoplanes sp. NBC_00393 TaxID=2975953 RepID=UPI002E1AD50B
MTSGDKAITVSWTPAALDDASVKYTATASPGGKSCTANSNSSHGTSCTIHGLTNGTTYTVTVAATTKTGASTASNPSEPVTPGTAPQPPTGVTAGPGDRAITVSWTPAALDGDTSVIYTATASPGGRTCTTNSNSNQGTLCTINGLTNGTTYTVTMTATTKTGTSTASAASGPVTPNTGPPPPGLQPPAITNAQPRNEAITVAWQPGRQGSGTLLGYTITATATNTPCRSTTSPCITTTAMQQLGTAQIAAADSASCTTTDATTCTITGLTNGVSYLISAVTHTSAGDSAPTPTEPTPTEPSTPTSPAPAPSPAPKPTLPTTGTPTAAITLTGWLMLTTGAALALFGYRRRTALDQPVSNRLPRP